MPNFFKSIFASEPPKASPRVDDPCEPCPLQERPEQVYKVVVTVTTRAGDIPVTGVVVNLDEALLGKTDEEGKSPESAVRTKPTTDIEVRYSNNSEGLNEEVFSLSVKEIVAAAKTFKAGDANHLIAKVQDVFGSGTSALGGDKDFSDTYAGTPDVSMTDTTNPDVKLLSVHVRLATLSLAVPYLSQVGPGETITIKPATPANPAGTQKNYKGSIICMPTSTKMCTDYWGITKQGGGTLSRNFLMQSCWDEHANPSPVYPCPWQDWGHLRRVVGKLAEAAHKGIYSVDSGPAGSGSASIPSNYADALVKELATGKPVVTSTYATAGHVMCVRGAVVDHKGKAQWLIFNDPYGNLASPSSIYDFLDIAAPVGLRGTSTAPVMNNPDDVRAVREVLTRLGHYSGALDGAISESDPKDPTVIAIKAFQGQGGDGRVDPGAGTEKRLNKALANNTSSSYSSAENEKNTASGAGSARGRHVYYNGETEARGPGRPVSGRFELKTQSWTLVIEPVKPLTKQEISKRLVPHK